MTVNQISVFLENEPGKLARFTRVLHDHDINIRALCVAEVDSFGILRIIVDDSYAASTVLKNAGYIFRITPVLAVPLKDEAGGLAEVVEVLSENGINIEYMYAFTGTRKGRAFVVLRVEDNERAAAVLTDRNYAPVGQDDLHLDRA